MALRIGVPRETAAGEKRVATVPDVVEKLIKLGFSVAVESGAGDAANFADDTYRAAGAEVLPTAAALWAARWELPLPVIVLGGIFGGVFAVSEAAAVTAVYVLIAEVLLYRDVKPRQPSGHCLFPSGRVTTTKTPWPP